MVDNWFLICATKCVLYTMYDHFKHALTYGGDQTKKRKRDIKFTTCTEVDIEQTTWMLQSKFYIIGADKPVTFINDRPDL